MNTESLWSKVLGRVVPKNVKRNFVLVAVFVELERERGVDEPRLSDLNAQMHLVEDVDILNRLADLAKVMFQFKSCPVDTHSVTENCSKVMSWLPVWLRYGERDKIFHDLAEMTVSHIR